jgi:hypothetical protein
MIPNDQIIGGIGDGVLKKLYMRAPVYHVQRASGNPVRIPEPSSVRNCPAAQICHWEKQLRKNINESCWPPDLYVQRRNRVFWVRLNATYYSLNWLSNSDNVQIVYVNNYTYRDRDVIDHGCGDWWWKTYQLLLLRILTKRLVKSQLELFRTRRQSRCYWVPQLQV